MKKFLLLIFLLTISIGQSQVLLQGFESGGINGGPFGGMPAPTIVTGTGSNTSQVLRIDGNTTGQPWQGINLFLSPSVDLTTNKTLTMDVLSSTPITFLVKATTGAGFPAASVTHNGDGTWQTLSFTFNTSLDGQIANPTGTYSGFVIHAYWEVGRTQFFSPTTCPTPPRTFFVDNIREPSLLPPATVGTFTVPTKNAGDPNFFLTPPTSNNTSPFTYSSSNNAIANIINGNEVQVGVGGTCTITASQVSDGTFAATSSTATFEVISLSPPQPVGLVVNSPTSSSVFLACGPNNAGSGDVVYRLFYSPTATAPANPTTATQYTFGSTPGDGNGLSAFGFVLTGLNSGTPYTFWLYQYNTTTGLYSPPNSVTATTTSATNVPQPVGFVAINPTATSMFLAVGPNNVGGNIVYRLFYSPTATAPGNPLTATQYTFGSTPGDGNGTAAFGFNLGGLSSSTNYTFWLYQYNTASGIYSTPAVSTNTTLAPPPVLIPPTTNAPVPTRNPANVVSVYSNTYSNIATNYDPNWGQSGHNLVNPNFVAVSGSGNTILHYANFNYQGTELTATNLSSMEFLHVDLWTNASTSNSIIQVSPINAGSGPSEVLVTINHVQGQWVSVDIPKSLFSGMTWDNVIQMKFAANGAGSTTPIDIYLDNVYFWNNPGVSTDATLSDLQVDFVPVSGFSSSQFSYTYTLPFGTTEIPQITSATTNNGAATTVINQATALPGSATVVVTAEDTSVQLTYTVNFAFPPPPAQPVGFVAFNPTSSSAFLACGPNNVDGNIVYRLFYSPTATAPVDPTTAIEYSFGATPGDGNGASPFGFVITGLNSSTNYTFWLYQYNTAENQFSVPATASLTTLCAPLNWYVDNDGDSYGVTSTLVSSCTSPGANYVNLDGDCNDLNDTVYPGALEICYDGLDNDCDGTIDEGCTPIISVVQTAQCGSTLSSINQQIFANLVAGAQGYRFRVTDMSTMQVQTIDRNLRVFQLTQLTNYAFDRTYQIEVSIRYNNVWQPFYGSPCTVTTPAATTQIQAAQCGGTLTTIGDVIYANNVPFATGYKFRITNLLTSAQQEVERPLRDIKMTQTSIAEFNSTYSVEVAVRNTNGAYLPYGTACNITTPSFPTTQLQLAQCDVILTNPNTVVYADSYAGATTYRFRFTNTSLGYTYQFDKPLRSFALNTVPGLLPGETYSVQVSVEIGGVFGPFGKVCTLTMPGATRTNSNNSKPALAFSAIVSPNPFGESFGLEVTASTEESIQVKVYDMLGKLVESRELDTTTVSELQIGATYPSGVYNVIVSQGEEVKTMRVIKR
ncbi:MopE-related protein [Flavobacterium sp.]|uniref:MopE-related protein n=1 Tax=Flavobacterium sp. TaxID=239 RepID=UPI002B4B2A71|nr:MopE-related protein [Flavobacterium sp.]HLP64331.1 MopE-related protein [Flavobacterium sp.]